MTQNFPQFFLCVNSTINFFFFFRESFNLWHMLLMITLYYQIKILIDFWYRWRLNFRSLIHPLKILPIKLIGTHNNDMLIDWYIIFFLKMSTWNSCENDITLYHNLFSFNKLCEKKKKAPNNTHFSWARSITFSAFLASDSKHKTNCDTPLGKVLVIKKGDSYKIWLT